jgi:hypothetical protein
MRIFNNRGEVVCYTLCTSQLKKVPAIVEQGHIKSVCNINNSFYSYRKASPGFFEATHRL